MPSLFVVRGRDQGKHYQLSDLVYRIGRDVASDIQLLDSEASRLHAEIRVDEHHGCELIDLGSSNGTRLNGTKIEVRTRLIPGDLVQIGDTTIELCPDGPGPMSGKTFAGYKLLKKIGGGEVSSVYLAWHEGRRQQAAVSPRPALSM